MRHVMLLSALTLSLACTSTPADGPDPGEDDGGGLGSSQGGAGGDVDGGGAGGTSSADASCTDGVENGGEAGVDCGGPCVPCTDYLPAFPGAIGPAATTPGGRGGEVFVVSSLADDGPGTLRACAEASGPRICVFSTSGEIALTSRLVIREPFLTIAGHTAPSPGITVRDRGVAVATHDVVIQHLRMRLGLAAGSGQDTFALTGGNDDVYNVITDHCSLSWGTDGTWDAWKRHGTISNITVSHSIVAETLEPHALTMLFNEAPDATADPYAGIVVAHNLMAHGSQRNPRVTGAGEFLVFNNVIYNWTYVGSQIADGKTGTPGLNASFVGNHYVSGPNRANFERPPISWDATIAPAAAYIADNQLDGVLDPSQTNMVDATTSLPLATTSPIDLSGYAILPAGEVLAAVTAQAGARPLDRDAVDLRVVADALAGTGQYIADPAEVGGFPVLAQNTRELELPDDPNGDDDGDGYTNVEEWLHTFYAEVQ